jgi:hypothetical protein
MITADQIPDEVVDALHSSLADDGDTLTEVWDCRVAIAAALNAWPGAAEHLTWPEEIVMEIYLPFPQKGGEE